MKSIALATLFIAACAGRSTEPSFITTAKAARYPAPRADVRSEAPVFPSLTSEAIVDFAATDDFELRRSHARPETKLRVCVAPTGAVDGVDLLASSGHERYDRAVLEAARNWKFQAVASAASARCTRMSVVYQAI